MIVTKTNDTESINERLIMLEAFSGNANLAKVLCDKFSVRDLAMSARLSYLSGEYEKAIELAKKANDIYLQVEILITTNKFEEAFSILKNEPLGPVFYYYSGVIYTQMQDYKKATACLEKAYEGFKDDTDEIRKLMTLINLAVAFNKEGEVNKATSIFNTAAKLIKKSDTETFPRFCSKFLVSYGFQLMQTGKLFLAYKYLRSAEKLINGNRSEEYFRCQVFLGYVAKQLGYHQKAISVLENIEPTAAYLNLDRLRYLAEAYLSAGEMEKSKVTVEKALSLSDEDKFSQIFLKLVFYQTQMLEGTEGADATFEQIELLCKEINDEISLSFALGKKAYLTTDVTLARTQADKLTQFEFQVEALECSLVIARKLVSTGSYQKALVVINKLDFSSSPVQRIEALLLKGLCYKLIDKKVNSYSAIDTALRLATAREDRLLIAKCLLIQMHVYTHLAEVIQVQKKYREVVSCLEIWQKKNLSDFFESLDCRVKFNVLVENKMATLSLLEFVDQSLTQDSLVLDVGNQVIIHGDEVFEDLKDFPVQWNLLRILTKHNATQPLTKELIVTQVLERTIYNPISDDNNINVTVHRLRKNLKKMLGFDPVVCKQGSYFLSTEYRITVLESLQPLKSLHVS